MLPPYARKGRKRMTAGSTASRLRGTWGYLRRFYWPFGSLSAKDIYELVSTNACGNDGLSLNLGYWKDDTSIDAACVGRAWMLACTYIGRAHVCTPVTDARVVCR